MFMMFRWCRISISQFKNLFSHWTIRYATPSAFLGISTRSENFLKIFKNFLKKYFFFKKPFFHKKIFFPRYNTFLSSKTYSFP